HAPPDRDGQLLRRPAARAGNRLRRPVKDKVNLAAALASFDEAFQPHIVGRYNESKIAVAKTRGEFVWHTHPDTDDLFLVLAGRLTIQLRDRDVELGPGDLYVVPRGVEHCPRADDEAHVLLIETDRTANTGDPTGRDAGAEIELGPRRRGSTRMAARAATRGRPLRRTSSRPTTGRCWPRTGRRSASRRTTSPSTARWSPVSDGRR